MNPAMSQIQSSMNHVYMAQSAEQLQFKKDHLPVTHFSNLNKDEQIQSILKTKQMKEQPINLHANVQNNIFAI